MYGCKYYCCNNVTVLLDIFNMEFDKECKITNAIGISYIVGVVVIAVLLIAVLVLLVAVCCLAHKLKKAKR